VRIVDTRKTSDDFIVLKLAAGRGESFKFAIPSTSNCNELIRDLLNFCR
jgi:hypothetical protein